MIFLLVLACAPPEAPPASIDDHATGEGHSHLVATTLTDDYSTGTLSTVRLDDWQVYDDRTQTSPAAVVRVEDVDVYQITRLNYDNIRRYVPGEWAVPQIEFSVGAQTNPHDIS